MKTEHAISSTRCRHCRTPLATVFADLGATPVSNDYLSESTRFNGEPFYPLKAFVCNECYLVQLEDFRRADDLFREDYAYFSSISSSWLSHAKRFSAEAIDRFQLDSGSVVVEVASNDGYLLQYFKASGLNVLGIEPCRSVAEFAMKEKHVPTRIEFFGKDSAQNLVSEGHAADLAVANNVLAHVPDINDFVSGFREILKADGVASFEFPHLMRLIEQNQFDTIYHEHFSYLSLLAVKRVFEANGLTIFDVEKISTHGGSLRVFACRTGAKWGVCERVEEVIAEERQRGLNRTDTYTLFGEKVRETKRALLELLISLKRERKTIVGYGAPAKGNTLLNYCGIGHDFLEYTVDLSPQKQGMYLPGTRLEIKAPDAIRETKPDYVLILPWNITDEITDQMSYIRGWGGQFIVPIPTAIVI